MTSPIISLNPKIIPQTTPGQPKPTPFAPKLLSKTAFPKRAPEGTRPPKREPGHVELGGIRRSVRRPILSKPEHKTLPATLEEPQFLQSKLSKKSA